MSQAISQVLRLNVYTTTADQKKRMVHTVISIVRELKQEDHELDATLGYL